jgi:hypothetical protein
MEGSQTNKNVGSIVSSDDIHVRINWWEHASANNVGFKETALTE